MIPPKNDTIIFLAEGDDPHTNKVRELLPGAKTVRSIMDLRQQLSAEANNSLSRVDIIGHGGPGRLSVGVPNSPGTFLENSHHAYSRLSRVADRFRTNGELRLLGCGVGLRSQQWPWYDGIAMAYSLSAMLQIEVTVSMGPLHYGHFEPGSTLLDAKGALQSVDARTDRVPQAIIASPQELSENLQRPRPEHLRPGRIPAECNEDPATFTGTKLDRTQSERLMQAFDFEAGENANDLSVLADSTFLIDTEARGSEVAQLVFGGAALLLSEGGGERTVIPGKGTLLDDELNQLIRPIPRVQP